MTEIQLQQTLNHVLSIYSDERYKDKKYYIDIINHIIVNWVDIPINKDEISVYNMLIVCLGDLSRTTRCADDI